MNRYNQSSDQGIPLFSINRISDSHLVGQPFLGSDRIGGNLLISAQLGGG